MWTKQPPARVAFPKWINFMLPAGVVVAGAVGAYLAAVVVYASAPGTQRTGYAPKQPVAFSHALHAGELGMDCRYCHNTVEDAAHAAVPPTQTCMGCHNNIRGESDKLIPIRESFATGEAVQWIRVHDLPDFVYFNHSAHVNAGVACVSCHGRVDKMEVVRQEMPLTMGWCLDCHKDPAPHLRPLDQVTNMDWRPMEDPDALGQRLMQEMAINPSTDCSVCHR